MVKTPHSVTEPLAKRWAMLRLVEAWSSRVSTCKEISQVLPPSKTIRVDGVYSGRESLWTAVKQQTGKPDVNRKRWHLDDPLAAGDHTWIVNNN